VLWSVLILTQPDRERFLARLLAVLKPQVEEYPDVEIITRFFDSRMDLGTNRQAMIEESSAEYCSQIDDDDLIPASYVSTIHPLLDGVDYIGFQLQYFADGVKQNPTYHSLRYKNWNADRNGAYRDISHVNPIRRELALLVPMSGGFGEDERWARALREKNVVKTEHYVNSIMYFYYFRSDKRAINPGPQATNRSQLEAPGVRVSCPSCGSVATGIAGGMRHCNMCAFRWGP